MMSRRAATDMNNTPDPLSPEAAFVEVTTGYYMSPVPRVAAQALRHALGMVAETQPENAVRFVSVLYLFHRVAQLSEEARALFEPILRDYRGPNEDLVRAIMVAPADAGPPNALRLEIRGPEHLDLLWAEFLATGSPDPVLRIVGVLDWEDRVRPLLDRWLRAWSPFGGARRRATAATLREAGLPVDLDSKAIGTDADLDCLCFSIAERRIPIFKYLPFTLPPADIVALGTKGSALWSLRLNSRQHARVAEICQAESDRPGGAARRRLIEPIDGKPYAL